ncbi:MAG: hypothetical protein HW415_1536 [Deltaproteobacteria bacterium]|nr:hypothetical protein [Deltaproteobacteria bacterium]
MSPVGEMNERPYFGMIMTVRHSSIPSIALLSAIIGSVMPIV